MTSPRPADTATPSVPDTPSARTHRLSRRAALALAGGAVGVLGIGWLADLLAVAPLTVAPTGPRTQQVGVNRVTLDLSPTPPRLGAPAQATISILKADGAPLSGQAVEVAATMVAMGMLVPAQPAVEMARLGHYACTLVFGMAGTWRVDVRFGQQGASQHATSFEVTVR